MNDTRFAGGFRSIAIAGGLASCLVLYGEGLSIGLHVDAGAFGIAATGDSLAATCSIALAFGLCAVGASLLGRLASSAALYGVLACAQMLGAVLLLGPFGRGIETFGGVLLGISSTIVLVCWGDAVIPSGAKRSSRHCAAAFVLASVFDIATFSWPDDVFLAAVVVLAAASPLLLWKVRQAGPDTGEGSSADARPVVVPAWAMFGSVVLYAVLTGGMQASGPAVASGGDPLAAWVPVLAADAGLLGAAALVWVGVRFLEGNNIGYYRMSIVAFISVSLYLSAALPEAWMVLAQALMTCVRMLVFVYVWTLFSTAARTASPIRLFSIGWLLFLVPNVVVTRIAQHAFGHDALWMTFGIALAFVLAAAFALEIVAASSDEAADDVRLRAAFSSAPAVERPDRIACLADRCGLTPREREVLVALARGRSARYIADTFVVSKETARTHIRHVYRKLEVHSREELLDLVEGCDCEGNR